MRKQDGSRYEKVLMRTTMCQLNPGSTPPNRTRIFACCLSSLASYLQPTNYTLPKMNAVTLTCLFWELFTISLGKQ